MSATWALTATQNAFWSALDVLRNADYGAALDDSRVDVARFISYATNSGITYPNFGATE